MSKIEELEMQLEALSPKQKPFKDRQFESLSKKSLKKPEQVLVQYLRNNRTVEFKLVNIVSGNIIVIDNKGHELNPKDTWIRGKHTWYIVREKDTKPVSIRDKPFGFSTDDHPVLIKMILGAVAKKDIQPVNKKMIIWIIIAMVLGLIGWAIFGG
jgi:hypothetical protein